LGPELDHCCRVPNPPPARNCARAQITPPCQPWRCLGSPCEQSSAACGERCGSASPVPRCIVFVAIAATCACGGPCDAWLAQGWEVCLWALTVRVL
jgi:hypothetical protein